METISPVRPSLRLGTVPEAVGCSGAVLALGAALAFPFAVTLLPPDEFVLAGGELCGDGVPCSTPCVCERQPSALAVVAPATPSRNPRRDRRFSSSCMGAQRASDVPPAGSRDTRRGSTARCFPRRRIRSDRGRGLNGGRRVRSDTPRE